MLTFLARRRGLTRDPPAARSRAAALFERALPAGLPRGGARAAVVSEMPFERVPQGTGDSLASARLSPVSLA